MTIFILITLALIIAAILIAGMVMRKEMVITSEIVIDRPKDAVWNFVKLLRNQEKYNTWIMSDPNIKMDYKGVDGMAGFIATWQSKTRMGDGEQEILQVNEGESFEAELRFSNHENVTLVETTVESIESNKTKVSTVMRATPSFPMNLMMPIMKNMLKKNMEQNNENLKRILEV